MKAISESSRATSLDGEICSVPASSCLTKLASLPRPPAVPDCGVSSKPTRSPLSDVAISVRILRSHAAVESVRELWMHWARHRDSDIDFCENVTWTTAGFICPHVMVLERNGEPEAMLVGYIESAYVEVKIGHLRFYRTSVRQLTCPRGALLGKNSAENCRALRQALIESLKKGEADVALLLEVDPQSPIFPSKRVMPGFVTRGYLVPPRAYHRMKLGTTIEEVYAGFSSGLRAELRRKKKRLFQAFGSDAAIRVYRHPGEMDEAVSRIEEIAKKTYQRRLDIGFEGTSEMRQHLRFQAEKGWLRMYTLSVNDGPCAFWVGNVYRGCFYSDTLGFDPSLHEYSPGTILLTLVVEDLCAEAAKEIDFGGGIWRYKERFGNCHAPSASVYIFAPSFRSMLLNLAHGVAVWIERMLRRLLHNTGFLSKLKMAHRGRQMNQNESAHEG